MIRNATDSDLDLIIQVHNQSFNGYFLTSLGGLFLKELYKSFMQNKSGIMRVVCDQEGKIIGFSAGTTSPEVFFSNLRIKQGWKFVLYAIPGLLKNPKVVLQKIVNAAFYKGDKTNELGNAALLSSIAVLPDYSGKSIGKQLLSDFEEQVSALSGCNHVYLITDKDKNENVISFYVSSKYKCESEFLQSGGRCMLRLVKSLK